MHALLHTVGAVVVVPYVALALFFLFIGQAARAKGMIAIIETVWNNFYLYFTKGIFVAPVLLADTWRREDGVLVARDGNASEPSDAIERRLCPAVWMV